MALEVYNTLTRQVEPFRPRDPARVQMFVCGPTVYDLSHVGHAKTYTQFDLVARYLRHSGHPLTYVQNITDVDDKIIDRARREGVEPRDLAARFEDAYRHDMALLGNSSVDVYARAHDFIDAIVAQVQRLIDGGHAYRLDDGWYFDLTSFPEYGKLSGRTHVMAEDAVARIDENVSKRNPGDFALWKASREGEPSWDTPLGSGRPGWHIEDTAITESLFGPQYDLHGGAVDLIFPHHEAEIAQMESASGRQPLAAYWMHTGFLRVGGDKMSKSLGNFMTVREALEQADYRTLRYAFLSNHYRSSMELTPEVLDAARSARQRVEGFARGVDSSRPEDAGRVKAVREQIFERLDDDFDTPAALAALFVHIREENRAGRHGGAATRDLLEELNHLFDAFQLDAAPAEGDQEIETEVARRGELRASRDYAAADAIRQSLAERGIVIEDTPAGTRWWRSTE